MELFIVFIADWLVMFLAASAAASLLWYVPHRQKIATYSRMLVAGLTSYMTAKFMALAYQPSTMRPFEIMGLEPGASYLDNPGFPSDHTLFVWVIVFAVWYGTRKPWLVLVLGVAAFLVSVGRVIALVHAPIDIIGGFTAAAIGALWYVHGVKFGRDLKNLAKKSKVV